MNTRTLLSRAIAGVVAFALAPLAIAQTPAPATQSLASANGLLVFPDKGQTPAVQSQDEATCYSWAKTNTGYDPASPPTVAVAAPPPPPPSGPTGARARGAVRGAAAGAVIGEVADNDADKGAAVGAAAGVLAGGRKERQAKAAQQQQAAQQQEANAQQVQATQQELKNKFKSGMGMCMESKGYKVK